MKKNIFLSFLGPIGFYFRDKKSEFFISILLLLILVITYVFKFISSDLFWLLLIYIYIPLNGLVFWFIDTNEKKVSFFEPIQSYFILILTFFGFIGLVSLIFGADNFLQNSMIFQLVLILILQIGFYLFLGKHDSYSEDLNKNGKIS